MIRIRNAAAPAFLSSRVLRLPFGQIPPPQNGQCTRSRKNWSHGQSNFASRCAMLRMENSQMTRAADSIRSLFPSEAKKSLPARFLEGP